MAKQKKIGRFLSLFNRFIVTAYIATGLIGLGNLFSVFGRYLFCPEVTSETILKWAVGCLFPAIFVVLIHYFINLYATRKELYRGYSFNHYYEYSIVLPAVKSIWNWAIVVFIILVSLFIHRFYFRSKLTSDGFFT